MVTVLRWEFALVDLYNVLKTLFETTLMILELQRKFRSLPPQRNLTVFFPQISSYCLTTAVCLFKTGFYTTVCYLIIILTCIFL